MAPPTFPASTPTNRRDRRKLQKQRRRGRQAQNCSGLWRDETIKASDEPREWLPAACSDKHSKPAAECILPKAYAFEPDLSRNFSTSESISQYRKDLLTAEASNPFSLLDVEIPSPTLSLPLPPQIASVQQSADQGHDVHGIGVSTAMGLPTPPPETASSLQKESVVTRSCEPLVSNLALPQHATVRIPPAEGSSDVPLHQYSQDVPVTEQESGIIRIPSPLLYHRRSAGASTEPFAEPHFVCQPTEPVFDKYNFTQTRLMSQIRAANQEEQNVEATPSTFVEARLPVMGEALSTDQSEDGGVSLQDKKSLTIGADKSATAASYLPPVLTTTNKYIFPKKVYHVVCQPNPAWSGPAYSNVGLSWTQHLVYPKLTIPGQQRQHRSSSSSSESSSQELVLHSAQPIKYARLATSMPVSIPGLQETRNRSSTQGSFDSKFDVATATRKLNIPALANSMSADTKVECWEAMSSMDPTVVVASGALNEKGLPVCDTSTADDTEKPTGTQPIETMVDWLFDELDSQCFVHTEQEASRKDAFAVRNEDLLAYVNASEAEDKANKMWFDYHAPLEDLEIETGSDLEEVDHVDAEVDESEWQWDNDEWESDELTPATECDEQLGLFATGWEY